jgi:hypothetical protein
MTGAPLDPRRTPEATMGFLDRLLGREPEPARAAPRPHEGATAPGGGAQRSPDERAIERYRYLLATAPPHAVEQAHAEAFAQLTPEQRRQVLQQLAEHVPPAERQGDDPASLARMATRTEMRRPGTLERTFGGQGGYGSGGYGQGGGPGFGAMVGGSLLGTVAGVVVGSAIANALFGPAFGDLGSDQFAGAGEAGGDAGGADAGPDPVADAGGDSGAGGDLAESGGGDAGGDLGGGGFGDLGGGDFGGDFGGGDLGGF